ncbi:effector-associated domain EAD1-containing protein [Burkholderia semiarida]|uniref:5'-methylthioadenosine/S-adenosylhomocysteine nucleosidase family protein n=1 Tax=Burkholderia TaxID=32008 RepID=UPI0026603B4B|nr:effector-associated domain EAD1-containing protein [Burkholderia sp. AU44665]MDN7702828.1 effector-associated domain EAD1-containing protein [Burkholderia sp. AU44665]
MDNSPSINKNRADVLVLCALSDEYREVLNVSDGIVSPGWTEKTTDQGWQIAEASFSATGGQQIRVVASFCVFMGGAHALATLNHLWAEYPARCVAMTGICGGRRNKVSLGDVIFADRLYTYDVGKIVVEDGKQHFQGDPIQYHPPVVWLQRIQAVASGSPGAWISSRPALTLEAQEHWVLQCVLDNVKPQTHPGFASACPDWSETVSRLWRRKWLDKHGQLTDSGREHAEQVRFQYGIGGRPSGPFKVHVAPIATGSSVIEDAGVFPRLAESMRKVLGVDMEASALAVAGEFMSVPVIVAKGVSDYGDPYKDDRYRHFAARAAAEYTISLMRQSVDLLRSGFNAALSDVKQQSSSTASQGGVPRDLLDLLADQYPDASDARALWVRAGGKAGQVESGRPFDMWQRLWTLSLQGAAARPAALLREVLVDIPGNDIVLRYFSALE